VAGDRPLTDGEDLAACPRHGGRGRARGIRIFTVGVGTPAGETIPVYDEGGRETGRKRGPDGEVVISRLDENLFRDGAPPMGRTSRRRTWGRSA
jgi:hypothetical protein